MKREQEIIVTAKCPKCRKTKKYSSSNPPAHTPYCPNGCGMPMFVHNIEIKTHKVKHE
jgi:hypothetical protein